MIRDAASLPRLRDRARRLLVVLPHPDDESYGCACTRAPVGADPRAATAVFTLTRGEASSIGPERGLAPEAVAALRSRRMEEVARILGLDALLLGDLPDGGLDRVPLDALGGAIAAVIDALRPQVVIGHDPRGVNAHLDHVAAHWATRHALLAFPGVRFAMLAYTPDVVEHVKPRLLFPTPDEEIDAEVRLAPAEIDAKEACLRVHEAIATLKPEHADGRTVLRPAVERYDFLGETRTPPAADLFDGLA